MYNRMSTIKKGEHRGRPRIYLQGKWLERASFAPGGSLTMEHGPGFIRLRMLETGERTVSQKRGIPVIDLNTALIDSALQGVQQLHVRVTEGLIEITPDRIERKKATRCENGKMGALFAGGGFLTQAAKAVGFTPAWAIEIDERYAEIYERNHPTAKMFNMSVHDVVLDDLEPVELLTVPIPCEPYSSKRRDKSGRPPEAHELGDMVFWALRIIDHLNPKTVVVEEVPGFLEAGAGYILRHALERMGYHVSERVVDPADHGELTGRKRAVVVASTEADVVWPVPASSSRTLGEVLDTDAGDWFTRETKPWLFEHWDRQTAKGNGFASQQLEAGTVRVQAISKRYFAGQGDCPVVKHPTTPGTYRWLTIDEVRQLHGIPVGYYLGDSKTTQGEVMGQSVVVPTFETIIRGATGRA